MHPKNEFGDFGKELEFTISVNDLMNFLKMYDRAREENPLNIVVGDKLWYRSIAMTFWSLTVKTKLKTGEVK